MKYHCYTPCSAPNTGWKISESELAVRRDMRQHRIFTIDPPTARDLDDALHVTELPDGTVEVRVTHPSNCDYHDAHVHVLAYTHELLSSAADC